MKILPQNSAKVKHSKSDTFVPGDEGRAMLKSNLSASSAPSGRDVSPFLCPDGAKAENFGGSEAEGAAPPNLSPSSSLEILHRHISAFDSGSHIYRAFVAAGEKGKADAFMHCGEEWATLECEHCGYTQKVAYNCKLRLCSRCAGHKMRVLYERYLPYVKTLDADKLRRIDLTIKNVEDLRDGVDSIRKSFTKLRHRDYYKEAILGGVYGIEAKPGKDGKWNVHLHILCYGRFIPQERLSDDWEDITGDSPIVWISRPGNPEEALTYVLKYVTKGVQPAADGWTGEELVEFILVLADKRLVQGFGCFLGKMAKKKPHNCPKCGWSLWKVTVNGEVTYDELERLLWNYRNRSP